jgi:hypothetical protein
MKFLKWSLPAAMLLLAGCGVTNQTSLPIPFLSSIPDDAKYIETVKLPTPTLEKAEGLKKARIKVLASSVGLADFPQLQSYAQSVLDRIIAAAPAGAPDAKVYLLANASPGAMAVPEGAIYIHFSAFCCAACGPILSRPWILPCRARAATASFVNHFSYTAAILYRAMFSYLFGTGQPKKKPIFLASI